jgi:hypothetical protein
LHAQVVAPDCLSGTCDFLSDSLCQLHVVGARLEIESSFTIGNNGGPCHPLCRLATAQCSSELAVTGDFTVTHGSESESVSLPQSEVALFVKWPGTCAGGTP